MQEEMLVAIEDVRRNQRDIEDRLSSGQARETVLLAIEQALASYREDRARLFGRIVGATLNSGTPDWSQAAEFIQDGERLTDRDVAFRRCSARRAERVAEGREEDPR